MTRLREKCVQLAKRVLWHASSDLYRRTIKPYPGQVFSIGIAQSPTIQLDPEHGLHIEPPASPSITHNLVTDFPAAFVADPFMLHKNGTWYLYFEALNELKWNGDIALATSSDLTHWQYEGRVLDEPFHCAYPYVFEADGQVYMIPDTPDAGVRLYQADEFPKQWHYIKTLLPGPGLSDATLFQHDGEWWMFVARSKPQHKTCNYYELLLYTSSDIHGEWKRHPSSPLLKSNSGARPGGRVFKHNNTFLRFGQDGKHAYGHRLLAAEVTALDASHYAESLCQAPVLAPQMAQWCRDGMHHLDLHEHNQQLVACMDGWHWSDTP